MKTKLIAILVANLFAASAAVAADDDFRLTGSVGLGLRAVDKSGADLSRFNEFRDLNNDSVISTIEVKGRGGSYHLDIFAENLGLDDQYIDLKGGQYGVFKYRLYDDRMRHNLTFGALTPLSPVGGSALTGLPNTNVATWNRFDYFRKREDLGGSLELSNLTGMRTSPWYVRADAKEITIDGVRPQGYANGTSPGNGFIELPVTVDYKIRNFSLEGGYSSKQVHASLSWLQSKFSNGVGQMTWPNPYFGGGIDTALQPPDNDLTKISGNVAFKKLPMDSTLAGRFTYSKLTNSFPVLNTYLGTGGSAALTVAGASPATFNGEHKNKSAALSLTSNPMKQLDTRVYWNYYDRDNNSTPIVYTAQGIGPHELLSYRKNNLGVDLGYRINAQNKLSGGLDWTKTTREERVDYDETKDTKVYAQLKNTSLDILGVRVKYQYTERRSNFIEPFVAPTDTSNDYLNWALRRFDVSSFNQDLFKIALDLNPVPLLDLGFDASYKQNRYKEVTLGRTKDDRQEFAANLSYGDPKVFRVSFFGDYEIVQYDAIYRYIGAGTCTAVLNCDPSAPPALVGTAAAYTWGDKIKDKNYMVGVGADWPVMERLTLKGSYIWSKTSGAVDFSALAPSTYPNYPTNITAYDNTRRQSLNLRGVYKADKHWEFTGGYAYERFRYDDDQSDNYTYTIGSGPGTSYLSGAYFNPNYTAHVFYVMGKYKF